jgi:hypothetical protein
MSTPEEEDAASGTNLQRQERRRGEKNAGEERCESRVRVRVTEYIPAPEPGAGEEEVRKTEK